VLRAVRENFDPKSDFILLPGTAQDTLDFTGPSMNRGSKMILDATSGGKGAKPEAVPKPGADFRKLHPDIANARVLEEALLVLQVKGEGRPVLEKVLKEPSLRAFKLIAAVSADVPLDNDVLLLWGIFTRFDCEQDVLFAEAKLEGSRPLYSGPLGMDSTWKSRYPKPVEMPEEITARVDRRWKEYGL
jgi:3-polyprenyl-4-hydroxybenzoate decarboxylase